MNSSIYRHSIPHFKSHVFSRGFLLIFIFFLVSCKNPKPGDVIARVDGEPILVSDWRQAYFREGEKFGDQASHDSSRILLIRKKLLEDLIQKKLLVKEAIRQGVSVSNEEVEKEIRKYKSRYTEGDFQKELEARKIDYETWKQVKRDNFLIDRWVEEKLVPVLEIPEEKIREYYQNHLEEFTRPESVRARQILTDTREKAESILQKIKEGENFAHLARRLSIAPDRKQGGDLGFISRGILPPEFDRCFEMKEGEVSEIIPSLYGFHIFKLIEKAPRKTLDFEEVRGQIEDWLRQEGRQQALEKKYQELRQHYQVEVQEWMLKKIKI